MESGICDDEAIRVACPTSEQASVRREPPLCVDLDGTLVKTDTLLELALALIKNRPVYALLHLPAWLLLGRARLKERVAAHAAVDWSLLPYTAELIDFLRREHISGRELVLVSACDRSVADRVAQHLGIFREVIGSDGRKNVKGAVKAAILTERFGLGGFDYIGNEQADLPVWRAARERLVANGSPAVVDGLVSETGGLPRTFATPGPWLKALLRAMRPHQWSKNLLVFVPLIAAHAWLDLPALAGAMTIFFAWSLMSSAIYLTNDLLDLEADRRHPAKCLRPFASGELSLRTGIVAAPLLAIAGLALAAAVSVEAGAVLALYAAASCAYSLHLKKRSLVDVFTLAFLFTSRVIGGGLASGYPVTVWLLVFTGFLFLGLAFLKRCSELVRIRALGRQHLGSRGYGVADLGVMELFGVASAFTAVMVLGLYVNNAAAETHYSAPTILWGVVPFLLLWLCRLWLATARGEMHDDPIVFSISDRVSWILGACVLGTFLLATRGRVG